MALRETCPTCGRDVIGRQFQSTNEPLPDDWEENGIPQTFLLCGHLVPRS